MVTNLKIVDNFYINPLMIEELTAKLNFSSGCGTGKRTIYLQEISMPLYNDFCHVICDMHLLNISDIRVHTYFMKHAYNEIDIFNRGWVHVDGKNEYPCVTGDNYNLLVCGQIFLSKNPDQEAGVDFYTLKQTLRPDQQDLIQKDYTLSKKSYDQNLITIQEYENLHNAYHEVFDLSCVINNKYNRMVSWNGGSLHGSKITKPMFEKLNQYFFVEEIK